MDPEHKLVDEGVKKYGVTDRQLVSESGGIDDGEIMLQKTVAEGQAFLRTEDLAIRDKNSECTENTGEEMNNADKTEEGHITHPVPHDQPPSAQVVHGTNSAEINCSVPLITDMIEVRNEKGTDDLQNSGVKTEVDVTSVLSVNHSESAAAINKGDENIVCPESKQAKDSQKKPDYLKPSSVKRSTAQTESWAFNVLLVRGLAPTRSGELKQLLNSRLGVCSHRIEPRRKGDSVLRIHFRSNDDLDSARALLHKQIVLGNKLTAVVENLQSQKRKAEKMDVVKNPPAKKMKQSPVQLRVKQVAYASQVAKKTKYVFSKLHLIAKHLSDSYPVYNGLIGRRKLDNRGFVCTVDKFKVCPPNERFTNRCKFSIGTDAVTGQFIVGLQAEGGSVKQVTSVPHNFPPHVVEAAKVSEKAIHACEQALEDPEGQCQYQFWHELIIRTNVAHDLMMLVYVKCPEDLAADKMTRVNKKLKEFFENGEGRKCHVKSLYTRVTYTNKQVPEQRTLVMGSPYLEEIVLDIKLQLLPSVHFWSNISAATLVCKGVEEMLSLTKKISLVEVGFGISLIGLHLSKFAGEVLSVVADRTLTEAQNNAVCNNITNMQYFGGHPVEALRQISEKITHDKACAVVVRSDIRCPGGAATVEALRKIKKVRRLVLVTAMSKACSKSIATLCYPSQENGLGNPFFPVRAIPVDTITNEESCVLLILMERIGLLSLPKSPMLPKYDSVVQCTERGPDIFRAAGPLLSRAKEAKRKGDGQVITGFQWWARELPAWMKEFKQRQRMEGLRLLTSCGGHGLELTAPYEQHLMERELSYVHDQMSKAVEEYHLLELRDQEWRRQIEEKHGSTGDEKRVGWIEGKEQRRWLEKEQQRRWLDKEQQRRQLDNKEHRQRIQEKGFWRCMGENVLNREMDEREFKREMDKIELQKWLEGGRERELVGMNPHMRSRNDIQEMVADSFREAEILHLSAEASQKLKQLVSEAIRTVGAMDRGERHGASTSSGFNRIGGEDITESQFGRSDKAVPQSGHFEDGSSRHIRDIDNRRDYRYDAYGGEVERSGSKRMPQSIHFDNGYSPSVVGVDSQYQLGCGVYEGAVRRDGYKHDLEPQQSTYSTREVPGTHIGVERVSSQPLRLGAPKIGSSNDVSHLEGSDVHMRRVYRSDFSSIGNREQKFGQLTDSYTRHGDFASYCTRNEQQPSRDMRQQLHSAVGQNEQSYMRPRAGNRNSSAVNMDYIPL